jgi:hypothetical protein
MYKIEFLHVLILCCFGVWLAREILKKKNTQTVLGFIKTESKRIENSKQ